MKYAKRIRYLISLAAILLMVGTAQWSGEQEVVFPEMVALTVGLWIIDKRVWRVRSWQVVTLMTAGASAGVFLVRFSSLPEPCNLVLAFCFAGVCLLVSRTTLIPLISACVLPVLLGTESLVYPAAVAVICFALVAGRHLMERLGLRSRAVSLPASRATGRDVMRWAALAGCVGGVSMLALLTGWPCLVLPPLMVAFVEMVNSKAGFRNRPTQVFLFLVTAAALGTLFRIVGDRFGVPQTVVGLCIACSLFLLFECVGKYFAPAGAMAFIPLLLPREGLELLPLQVAVGGALFLTIAMVGFQRCYTWSRAQLLVCAAPTPLREYLARRKKRVRS